MWYVITSVSSQDMNQFWKRTQIEKEKHSQWPEEDQTDDVLEQSGQQKWPRAWHFGQAMDCTFTFDPPPPTDWYKSSSRLKPKGPPLNSPVPLHFEHAIILRLPHLLHIPKLLNITRSKVQHKYKIYQIIRMFTYI